MKKLKEKIIDLLGGVTKEKTAQLCNTCVSIGRYSAFKSMEHFMRDINGAEAEEWCDLAWKFVQEKKSMLKKTLTEAGAEEVL